jgi:hypothetical protein
MNGKLAMTDRTGGHKQSNSETASIQKALWIVVSNPTIGTGAGATGMFFYDIGSDRDVQPRSSVQLVGAYTHTDSCFVGLMNSLHVLQDQVRSKAGLFHATINNEYRDPLGGEADFSTDVLAAFAQVTCRIKGDWFLGIQGIVFGVQYRPDTTQDGDYLDRVGAEETTSGGIGPVVSYDSRDNIHYPRSGTLAAAKGFYKPSSWGNEADYAVGGLAKLWDDDLADLITEDLYYSVGAGIRFMINTDQKINFRIDAAAGNGDNKGICVGIREAF